MSNYCDQKTERIDASSSFCKKIFFSVIVFKSL